MGIIPVTSSLLTSVAAEWLPDFYRQLRLDSGSEDTLATMYLMTALQRMDGPSGILGRCLAQQTYDYSIDQFPGGTPYNAYGEGFIPRYTIDNRYAEIRIPLPPLVSVTSLSYVDQAGDTVVMDAALYRVVQNGDWPASIQPALGQTWPLAAIGIKDAVTVRFVAGYAPGAGSPTLYGTNIPQVIKHAALLMAAQWYGNREGVCSKTIGEVPNSVSDLLEAVRVRYR